MNFKIGDRIFVHGYIDEIRKDTVIIRNNGGYFGTIPSEVITGDLPSAQPEKHTNERTETYACDLISRQAAKLKVAMVIWEDGDSCYDFHDKCVDCLDDVPSAQPEHNPDDERKISDLHKMVNCLLSRLEQRWIPVSERLPEDEYVLISKKPSKISGNKWCVTIAIRVADPRSKKVQWRDIGFSVIPDDKILAWRPLPEPYREEGEADG